MGPVQDLDINKLANQTLVMLLAGGQGSRLYELTHDRAKPSLEFGGAYKLIDFPLSNCVNSGFKKIGVVTQYKAQILLRHLVCEWSTFNRSFGEFLELLPASQQQSRQWYQGTADSLFQNIDFIKSIMPKYVLVLSGDHIYTMDYRAMLKTHVSTGAQMTVSCIRVPTSEAAGQFGVMNVDKNDRIVSFEEKPLRPLGLADSPDHVLASMGNYIFNTDCLIEELQKDAQDMGSDHDFGKDIIPKLIESEKVQAFRFGSATSKSVPYWKDVGTLDAYWTANMALLSDRPAINLRDANWPIIGDSTCTPPTKFASNKTGKTADIINTLISSGCSISPCKISDSLVFDNAEIMNDAHIVDSILLPNVKIGQATVIKRAIIDRDCIVPDNMKIGVNIKDDLARGFRVSKNDIVLVTKNMLERLNEGYLLKPQTINADCHPPLSVVPCFTERVSRLSIAGTALKSEDKIDESK